MFISHLFLQTVSQLKATNITVEAASLPIPFGTHHTKLSLFESCSRVHLIISTANLVPGLYLVPYIVDSSSLQETGNQKRNVSTMLLEIFLKRYNSLLLLFISYFLREFVICHLSTQILCNIFLIINLKVPRFGWKN